MTAKIDEMTEATAHEQRVWEHYKAIEAENFHLRKQLNNRNDQIRALKASYRTLNDKYKELTKHRKPRFRNKGKKVVIR